MAIFDKTRRSIARAAELRRRGDSPGAIDILADVLRGDPDHAGANAEMARALRLLGDPEGAEEHLRRALAVVLDYQLVVELAATLAEQERVDEAEEYLDAALYMADRQPRLDPAEALLVRAAIALGQDRPEDARAALDQVVPKRSSKQTLAHVERLRAEIG